MEDAKSRRTIAKSQFTRAENMLKSTLIKRDCLSTTIERRYVELKAKWDKVEQAHNEYVSTLTFDSEEATAEGLELEEQWINELAERLCEIEIATDQAVERIGKHVKIEVYQGTAQTIPQVTTKPNTQNIVQSTERTNVSEPPRVPAVTTMSTSSSSVVPPGVVLPVTSTSAMPIAAASTVSHGSTAQTIRMARNIVQIEPVKFRSFDGDIRRYPLFKDEFTEHIMPQCADNQIAYVLKKHLAEKVCREVESAGNDAVEIWRRLDQKYGDSGKLVEIIISDVKALQINSRSDAAALEMIEVI